MDFLLVGVRYLSNLVCRVGHQRGSLAAVVVGSRFVINEIYHIFRFIVLTILRQTPPYEDNRFLTEYSESIVQALPKFGVESKPYCVDLAAWQAHLAAFGYPKNYAAGSMSQGGSREQKLLEYYVSIDLLDVRRTDVVIDIASEWSLFPDVIRRCVGATVYRQDLIYPPGVKDYHIGGSATFMPISDQFADILVLHNAFEHFEGNSDTSFIKEAWRILKPGGKLCILPLLLVKQHTNLTDPLVYRRGVVWDEGAQIIEQLWWHNRFGRFYDLQAFNRRVLMAGKGFKTTIYHVTNPEEAHPNAYLHFVLIMQKPNITVLNCDT